MKLIFLLALIGVALPGRAADDTVDGGPAIVTNLAPANLPDFKSIGLTNLTDSDAPIVVTNAASNFTNYYLPKPITIECRVKLNSSKDPNILVASEPRSSVEHWDLHTSPKEGYLKLLLNGRDRKAVTQIDICDGKWHSVAAVIETDRARVYLDGKLVADEKVDPEPEPTTTNHLGIAFGTLAEGGQGCDGVVESARLSRGVRTSFGAPGEPFERDDETVGLWNNDELKAYEKARLARAESQKPLSDRLIITPAVKPLPNIVRGPYLQSGSTNRMVVRWRTDLPTPSLVTFGKTSTSINKKATSYGLLTEHVVLITNLQPDTKYFYSIGTPSTPLYVTLTNNILFVTVSNGPLAVSAPNRVQFAATNNGTLVIGQARKGLAIGNLGTGNLLHTTNKTLLVSTANQSLLVGLTNNILYVSVSNTLYSSRSASAPVKKFSLGGVGNTFVGADTNTWFYTAPLIGSKKPIRLWVLGDPGTRSKGQTAVRDAYYKFTHGRRTDLWMLLGDNAYDAGTDVQYQGAIFDMYSAMLRTSVLWPTLGNHDGGSANSPTQSGVYYDIFTLPTRGECGGLMSGTKAYFSFDHGNVHIICIDSYDTDRSTNGTMAQWLAADLAANTQDWCIAYWHHPPYSKGSHDADKEKDNGEMTDMRRAIVPILEAGGVDMVLTGHSHAYERSFLIDGLYKNSNGLDDMKNIKSEKDGRPDGSGVYRKPTRGPAKHEGAVYVVAGSSGQTSGGTLSHPAMCLSLNVLGSLVLDFDGNRLDTTFVDDKAVVRDYFSIVKGPADEPSKP